MDGGAAAGAAGGPEVAGHGQASAQAQAQAQGQGQGQGQGRGEGQEKGHAATQGRPLVLDEQLLGQLEQNANVCAENMAHLLGSLRSALHAISAMSTQYMDTYKDSVESVGENVTMSVLAMHQFIQKAKELNQSLKGIEHLEKEITTIKSTLDQLEAAMRAMNRAPR
eukprot:TRINITY_DN5876_c0_g1_i1.p1 TRINITY_DN5876_c0_g1~~TRINITY_DN5876_c0_g1_i1.p1  ORF type:complete len:167 (+),score=52.79 TRINITY_DN5876_c0_g1_i1:197-697(+)